MVRMSWREIGKQEGVVGIGDTVCCVKSITNQEMPH